MESIWDSLSFCKINIQQNKQLKWVLQACSLVLNSLWTLWLCFDPIPHPFFIKFNFCLNLHLPPCFKNCPFLNFITCIVRRFITIVTFIHYILKSKLKEGSFYTSGEDIFTSQSLASFLFQHHSAKDAKAADTKPIISRKKIPPILLRSKCEAAFSFVIFYY